MTQQQVHKQRVEAKAETPATPPDKHVSQVERARRAAARRRRTGDEYTR
jgi:hypothetical protein